MKTRSTCEHKTLKLNGAINSHIHLIFYSRGAAACFLLCSVHQDDEKTDDDLTDTTEELQAANEEMFTS